MFQPVFPLKYSKTTGPYKGITDIKDTIKQNVIFLLSVSPGEWPANPELGVGVRRFLFENYGSQELAAVHARIKDQFAKYLPFLKVSSELIEVDTEGRNLIDNNQIKLVVKYNIKPLNVEEYVEIGV
jgi:phage baseplate assembly protein W